MRRKRESRGGWRARGGEELETARTMEEVEPSITRVAGWGMKLDLGF
jgi:hypothetical protein